MNLRRNIFIIITLAWVCLIFSFSLQPAEASSQMSAGVSRWILENVFPRLLARLESASQAQMDILHTLLRKCGHFSEFFMLGIWSMLTIWETKIKQKVRIGILFCMIVAAMDETIQLFINGRSGQISDVLLDSAGAATGIFFLYICRKLIHNDSI